MEAKIIIKKNNQKAKKVLASAKSRKDELKAFLAAGGKLEDFHAKKSSLA